MKILWIKTDFLHPTTRGGQIRTLETLRCLHRRHEVHYVAFCDEPASEGERRAHEYASKWYPVLHRPPDKRSPRFLTQLAAGLVSQLPVAVFRWQSDAMRREVERITSRERFDAVICDFLAPAPNIPDLSASILFQHNVEAEVWRRHSETANGGMKGWYFARQYARMLQYERQVCRKVKRVIAVSENDAHIFREQYGVRDVAAVPTGVDVEGFRAPPVVEPQADLVFVGSMDWMPNIDGVVWFTNEVLPLVRNELPGCRFAVVGRKPSPEVRALAARDPGTIVTGTVADVRPWLWGSKATVVPLRIGGGTRLKIYESMAAGVPVVSTTVGAEGLEAIDGENIVLADSPEAFASRCVALLSDSPARARMAAAGRRIVEERYSWESVSREFERLLF